MPTSVRRVVKYYRQAWRNGIRVAFRTLFPKGIGGSNPLACTKIQAPTSSEADGRDFFEIATLRSFHSRRWRNWYTRSLEEAVPKGLRVQVPLSAPEGAISQVAHTKGALPLSHPARDNGTRC